MTEARIAQQGGTAPSSTSSQWNTVNSATTSFAIADLLDITNTATGWGYTRSASVAVGLTDTGGPTAPTNPAAAWVDENIIARSAIFTAGTVNHEFTGLNDGDTYTIEIYSARESTSDSRTLEASVSSDFSGSQTLVSSGNTGDTLIFSGLSPTTGALTLYTRSAAGSPYQNAVRIYSESGSAQVVRKSSQFVVNKTLSGTVVSATLNGNAIQIDSQDTPTITLTDTASGITTTGQYNLVLTNDAGTPDEETIPLQVQVVGMPAHTFTKDGAGLSNLSDIDIDLFNLAGTALALHKGNQTSNASAIIPAQDFSGQITNVDDVHKVSIYSAAVDVGITFEQAMELI